MLTLGSVVCFAEAPETKFSDEVLTILEGVSAKLQVPVSKIWDILVSVQKTAFISNAVSGLLLLAISGLLAWGAGKLDDDHIHTYSVMVTLAIIFGLVGFIVCIVAISQIPYAVNPEYGALKEILNLLK